MAALDLSGLGLRLRFGGGTALFKAHRRIRRFSEDIDFKLDILGTNVGRREGEELHRRIMDAVQKAGYHFTAAPTPANPLEWQEFVIGYRRVVPKGFAAAPIREGIQIEISPSQEVFPPATCALTSLAAETEAISAGTSVPEGFPIVCVDEREIALDKLLAMPRRFYARFRNVAGMKHDERDVRHLYDIHCLMNAGVVIDDDFRVHAHEAVDRERERHRGKDTAFDQDPLGTLRQALNLMANRTEIETQYRSFVGDFVPQSAQRPTFRDALVSFKNAFEAAFKEPAPLPAADDGASPDETAQPAP
nr:nucleotidyl transferase AbiEii/AbiGii toxin family protein [Azospirillum soli]